MRRPVLLLVLLIVFLARVSFAAVETTSSTTTTNEQQQQQETVPVDQLVKKYFSSLGKLNALATSTETPNVKADKLKRKIAEIETQLTAAGVDLTGEKAKYQLLQQAETFTAESKAKLDAELLAIKTQLKTSGLDLSLADRQSLKIRKTELKLAHEKQVLEFLQKQQQQTQQSEPQK